MSNDATATTATDHPSPPNARRAALASLVGAIVDWYDYFLYGTASALVFGPLFFPGDDPVASQLASYATFAVGFFFRPIGGIVFGHFGDRIGRKRMLVLTLMVMGCASIGIGLLPTYQSIGVLAPILLVTLRAIQGFAVGGEWAGATLLAIENAPAGKTTRFGSVVQHGAYVGILTANGAYFLTSALVRPTETFLEWGWRIPFVMSIVVVVVGLIIRRGADDGHEFQQIKKADAVRRLPLLAAFRENPSAFFIVFGMRVGENVANYLILTFSISYVTKTLGVDSSISLSAILLTAVAAMCFIPFVAAWADRRGPFQVYVFGASAGIALAFPFFWGLNTGNFWVVLISVMVTLLLVEVTMAVAQQPIFTRLFKPEFRYSGAGFAYQITAALGGGLAPLIATALVGAAGGATYPAALYMLIFCGISLITTLLVRDRIRSGTPIGMEPPDGSSDREPVRVTSTPRRAAPPA